MQELDTAYRNVQFFDGARTIELLDKYYPEYFTVGDLTIANYFRCATEIFSHLVELHTIGGLDTQRRLPIVFVPPRLERVNLYRSKRDKKKHTKAEVYPYERLRAIAYQTLILEQ